MFNIIKFFLDPGSRPPAADLAGMTSRDTVSRGERERLIILRSQVSTEKNPQGVHLSSLRAVFR